MAVTVTLDRGAAEALAEAAEVRCSLLAAHMDRLPDGDRALVMGEIVRVQRGAEAVRAALHGRALRAAPGLPGAAPRRRARGLRGPQKGAGSVVTLYFKATRPDGTDFRTGAIDYGAALLSGGVVRHPAAKLVLDDASTYLSVSVSEADCTGMSWPCRLFRVEPVGRVSMAADLPSKRCASALRVVEELPAWRSLGPNGDQVARLVESCRSITREQADGLRAAGAAAWAAAGDAAGDAARDAAGALVVRDLITPKQFDLLAGPWRGVMGATWEAAS